ncbi:RNA-dependent RNA polymerase [Beihai sesarmid crab virus 4]|uniref:RNA-dependent RNA polymerase n=1 Tax=Beihai sesarmid crab virus 4 TaxID=1922664 RepID=A0A1L3KKZ2_9VIRU|nr:RNA-dependent RNA polymerase [Beihai sesarmid crab virus 4]APG78067.1 RNA-dependent RNA polymerase [Beihai sesarmid crab virus 4]
MAKVFDTPRYKDQVQMKVKYYMECAQPSSRVRAAAMCSEFGYNYLDLETYDTVDDIGYATSAQKYAYRETNLQKMDMRMRKNIGDTFAAIFKETEQSFFDFDAVFRLVAAIANMEIEFNRSRKDRNLDRSATSSMRDIVMCNITDAKTGSIACDQINKLMDAAFNPTRRSVYLDAARAFCERLMVGGSPVSVNNAHDSLRSNNYVVNAEGFVDDRSAIRKLAPGVKIYKVIGIYVLQIEKASYVLDNAAAIQLYTCVTFWSGMDVYLRSYHLQASRTCPPLSNVFSCLARYVNTWVGKDAEVLPRHVKDCMAVMQNEYNNHLEKYDTKAHHRSVALRDIAAESACGRQNFLDILATMHLSPRSEMDVAYWFHGLPAPDCDAELMFKTFTTKLDNSNYVNEQAFKEFMNYSKTYDLVHIIARHGREAEPFIVCEDGYEYCDSVWFAKCLEGKLAFPPAGEFGRAYIKKFFPFESHMDYWHFEAADVTRVIGDERVYDDISVLRDIEQYQHNELLYALKHAPLLGSKFTPQQIRKQVIDGKIRLDSVLVVAAKSENTKFGGKVRETYSAADHFREVTSELDRTAIPVAKLGAAAALRMPPPILDKLLGNMARDTSNKPSAITITMSLDVSGWSPNASRRHMLAHHKYITELSDIPNGYNVNKMWSTIQLYVNKRGNFLKKSAPSGMFQGFTGTLDTTLHQHMAYFAIRKCKDLGVLRPDEAAAAACLIDDGVLSVTLSMKRNEIDKQKTIKLFCETITRIYATIGYKIDPVKTICSTNKFTFLNRFYADGNEVVTPMKVFSKIDREFDRKFASLRENLSTYFGSAFSAVVKGCDPVLAYCQAVKFSLILAGKTSNRFLHWSAIRRLIMFHAPATVGGLSCPTFVDWCTPEIKDKHVRFVGFMKLLRALMDDCNIANDLDKCVTALYTRQFKEKVTITDLAEPREIRYIGIPVPEGCAQGAVKQAIQKFCTSSTFNEALRLAYNPEFSEAFAKIIRGVHVDASVLEELVAVAPVEVVAPLRDRAVKNSLLALMLPYRERKAIRAKVSSLDRKLFTVFDQVVSTKTDSFEYSRYQDSSAFNWISSIRDDHNEFRGLKIYNHTLPDPHAMIARAPNNAGSTLTATLTKIAAPDKRDKFAGRYANAIDGICTSGRYYGVTTRGLVSLGSHQIAGADRVKSIIVRGTALVCFIAAKGGDGMLAWNIFCALWGLPKGTIAPRFDIDPDLVASTKRLGSSFTNKYHMCCVYPNTSSGIVIDSTNLYRWLDNESVHVDAMGVLNCLRSSLSIERAYHATGEITLPYHVALGSVKASDDTVLASDDSIQIDEYMAEAQKFVPKGFSDKFNALVNDPDRCVEFEDPDFGERSKVRARFSVEPIDAYEPGGLADLILKPANARKHIPIVNIAGKVVSAGDIELCKKRFAPHTVYRKLSESVEKNYAILGVLIALACRAGKTHPPDSIYTIAYRNTDTIYREIFDDTPPQVVLAQGRKIAGELTAAWLALVFPNMPVSWRRSMAGTGKMHLPIEDYTRYSKKACVLLYMMGHGRFFHHDLYEQIAHAVPRTIKTCWRAAFKRCKALEGIARAAGNKHSQTDRHIAGNAYTWAPNVYNSARTVKEIVQWAHENILANAKDLVDSVKEEQFSYTDIYDKKSRRSIITGIIRSVYKVNYEKGIDAYCNVMDDCVAKLAPETQPTSSVTTLPVTSSIPQSAFNPLALMSGTSINISFGGMLDGEDQDKFDELDEFEQYIAKVYAQYGYEHAKAMFTKGPNADRLEVGDATFEDWDEFIQGYKEEMGDNPTDIAAR